METLLLAGISDKMSILLWTKTKDGQSGKNRPALILDALNNVNTRMKDTVVFSSGEEFERRRRELIQVGGED